MSGRGARHGVPPTGRSFATQQSHWLRLTGDGRVAEHWVNRDDLGIAMQLGWVPPTPAYLLRIGRREVVRALDGVDAARRRARFQATCGSNASSACDHGRAASTS
jgi:hypothetical protein